MKDMQRRSVAARSVSAHGEEGVAPRLLVKRDAYAALNGNPPQQCVWIQRPVLHGLSSTRRRGEERRGGATVAWW
jgi:hypothetical protein